MKSFFARLTRKKRFEKEDFVLLKTALMLAALDGEVGEDEVARFRTLAEKCRGYSGEAFKLLWESALRSAGYLLLQTHFLAQDELVATFVREAEKDFVGTVILETREERRRAFKLLDAMAMADGDYSEIERAAIAALREKVMIEFEQAMAERYSRAAYVGGSVPAERTE